MTLANSIHPGPHLGGVCGNGGRHLGQCSARCDLRGRQLAPLDAAPPAPAPSASAIAAAAPAAACRIPCCCRSRRRAPPQAKAGGQGIKGCVQGALRQALRQALQLLIHGQLDGTVGDLQAASSGQGKMSRCLTGARQTGGEGWVGQATQFRPFLTPLHALPAKRRRATPL